MFRNQDPSDDSLYLRRWSQILDPSFHHEFVQIISWNDYGESHCMFTYIPCASLLPDADVDKARWTDIAPISGSQPGSESWTDGMNHDGWLEMTKWFVRRYKGLPNNQRERVCLPSNLPCSDIPSSRMIHSRTVPMLALDQGLSDV